MKKQVKLTVITPKGVTECCGWFKDTAFGEAYAEKKLNAGCIVRKQYREVEDEHEPSEVRLACNMWCLSSGPQLVEQ